MTFQHGFHESMAKKKLEQVSEKSAKPENNLMRKILESRRKDRTDFVNDLIDKYDSLKYDFSNLLANQKIEGFKNNNTKIIQKTCHDLMKSVEDSKAIALQGIEQYLGYANWKGTKPFQTSLHKLEGLKNEIKDYIQNQAVENSQVDVSNSHQASRPELEGQHQSKSNQASTSRVSEITPCETSPEVQQASTSWKTHYDNFKKLAVADPWDSYTKTKHLGPRFHEPNSQLEEEILEHDISIFNHDINIEVHRGYLQLLGVQHKQASTALTSHQRDLIKRAIPHLEQCKPPSRAASWHNNPDLPNLTHELKDVIEYQTAVDEQYNNRVKEVKGFMDEIGKSKLNELEIMNKLQSLQLREKMQQSTPKLTDTPSSQSLQEHQLVDAPSHISRSKSSPQFLSLLQRGGSLLRKLTSSTSLKGRDGTELRDLPSQSIQPQEQPSVESDVL